MDGRGETPYQLLLQGYRYQEMAGLLRVHGARLEKGSTELVSD
jgi:hypothetical protein